MTLKGWRILWEVLTGQYPVMESPRVADEEIRQTPLNPESIRDYNEIDFATLVKQGRVRCIEWYVIQGREVGFDHDLMLWCNAPGFFQVV